MKALPFSLTCLLGILAGFPIGRWCQPGPPLGISHPASPETPAVAQSPATSGARALLHQTRSLHGKTARMLNGLSDRRPGFMQHLVEACQGDSAQLWLLRDLALSTDPAGFITALEKGVPGSRPKTEIGRIFAGRWAKLDAAAAFKTCHALPDPFGGNLSPQALKTLVNTDPGAALRLLAAYPEADLDFDELASHLLLRPDGLALVKSLPRGVAKSRLTSSLSYAACNLSPETAFDLVLKDRSSSPLFGLGWISMQLADNDRQGAQDWVRAHPDHPAAASLAKEIGRRLAFSDPAAAVEWAAAHLSGPSRTDTLEKAANTLEKTDPAAADAARQLLPTAFKFSGTP